MVAFMSSRSTFIASDRVTVLLSSCDPCSVYSGCTDQSGYSGCTDQSGYSGCTDQSGYSGCTDQSLQVWFKPAQEIGLVTGIVYI